MFDGIKKDLSKTWEVCSQVKLLRDLSTGGSQFLHMHGFAPAIVYSCLYRDTDSF